LLDVQWNYVSILTGFTVTDGAVKVVGTLDRETTETYTVLIEVVDNPATGQLTTTVTLSITVTGQ